MAEIPLIILRSLGILLVLIGLSGTLGGMYAVKVVHDYNLTSKTPTDMRASIYDVSRNLDAQKADTDRYLSNINSALDNASRSVIAAGDEAAIASDSVGSAASDLTNAGKALKLASSENADAGIYLGSAANELSKWADDYSYNGTPLPYKYRFDGAVSDIEMAAGKLKDSGARLESAASNMDKTASNLKKTSSDLKDSSTKLKEAGAQLNQTAEHFNNLKEPLGSLISGIAATMKSSAETIERASGIATSLKTIAYGLIGYLILLHVIILGIGIALAVIETELFLPGGGGGSSEVGADDN